MFGKSDSVVPGFNPGDLDRAARDTKQI